MNHNNQQLQLQGTLHSLLALRLAHMLHKILKSSSSEASFSSSNIGGGQVHTCMHTHIHTHVCMPVHTYTHHIHTHTPMCPCVYTHTCTHKHIHSCANSCMHTHIHTHHTNTHACTCAHSRGSHIWTTLQKSGDFLDLVRLQNREGQQALSKAEQPAAFAECLQCLRHHTKWFWWLDELMLSANHPTPLHRWGQLGAENRCPNRAWSQAASFYNPCF